MALNLGCRSRHRAAPTAVGQRHAQQVWRLLHRRCHRFCSGSSQAACKSSRGRPQRNAARSTQASAGSTRAGAKGAGSPRHRAAMKQAHRAEVRSRGEHRRPQAAGPAKTDHHSHPSGNLMLPITPRRPAPRTGDSATRPVETAEQVSRLVLRSLQGHQERRCPWPDVTPDTRSIPTLGRRRNSNLEITAATPLRRPPWLISSIGHPDRSPAGDGSTGYRCDSNRWVTGVTQTSW